MVRYGSRNEHSTRHFDILTLFDNGGAQCRKQLLHQAIKYRQQLVTARYHYYLCLSSNYISVPDSVLETQHQLRLKLTVLEIETPRYTIIVQNTMPRYIL